MFGIAAKENLQYKDSPDIVTVKYSAFIRAAFQNVSIQSLYPFLLRYINYVDM